MRVTRYYKLQFIELYCVDIKIGATCQHCEPKKDIGSENPETAVVSGFCYAIFQGVIQKISFPPKRPLGRT